MGRLIPVKAKDRTLYAQVDDDDFDRLSKFRWYLTSNGYAIRVRTIWNHETKKKSSVSTLMHRDVMGHPDSDVDHFDRNKLNNTKSNLRWITDGQNLANRPSLVATESGFRGVFKNSVVNGRVRWKGMYRTSHLGGGYGDQIKRELAMRYDLSALRDIGLSADLNFPIAGVR